MTQPTCAQTATAIQGTVLTELAKLDLGAPAHTPAVLFAPIRWYGGLVSRLSGLINETDTTLTVVNK
jgi:hypothetical protein